MGGAGEAEAHRARVGRTGRGGNTCQSKPLRCPTLPFTCVRINLLGRVDLIQVGGIKERDEGRASNWLSSDKGCVDVWPRLLQSSTSQHFLFYLRCSLTDCSHSGGMNTSFKAKCCSIRCLRPPFFGFSLIWARENHETSLI